MNSKSKQYILEIWIAHYNILSSSLNLAILQVFKLLQCYPDCLQFTKYLYWDKFAVEILFRVTRKVGMPVF